MSEATESPRDLEHTDREGVDTWSLRSAVALVLFTAAAALLPGLAIGAVIRLMPVGVARTLVIGLALSAGYLAVLLVVALVARGRGVKLAALTGWRPTSTAWTVAGGTAVALGGRLVAAAWGIALQALGVELPGQDLDPTRLLPADPLGVIVLVVVACVLAPVTEEIVFRGVLLPSIALRWGFGWGNAVSSALFSAVHVFLYAIPPVFLLSLGLGWLVRRSGSIVPSVFAHALFNLVAVVGAYALRFSGAA